MATIDIHDLSGAKVGTLELADEVFGAVNVPALTPPRIKSWYRARARNFGSKKVQGGPA